MFIRPQRAAAPWSQHHWWGQYTDATSLPNMAASDIQVSAIELQRGDIAWSEADSVLYTCTVTTPGAAVWVPVAGSLIQGQIVLWSGGTRTVFGTIAAAFASAIAGDIVLLGPGDFAESVTIPDEVQLVGAAGINTAVIIGAAPTGTRVTMGEGSSLANIRMLLPTDATPAVLSPVATSATLKNMGFTGVGAAGFGFRQTGAGATFLDRVSYFGGTCDTFIDAAAGTIQANETFLFAGTLTNVVRAIGGAFSFVNLSVAVGVVAGDGVEVGVNGTVRGQVGRLLGGITNAIHITDDTASVEFAQVEIDAGVADILADPGVSSAHVHVTGGALVNGRIDVPGALRSSPSWLLAYHDETDGDEATIFESGLTVGAAEKGTEAVFGEGDSYVQGMVVLTTDGTAGPVADGGNLTDVSVAAASASGSTFTFQGLTAGHAIIVGSTRANGSVVKHWGLKILQTIAAAEVTPHSFIMEIWDGAAWVETGCLLTHADLFFRYANEMFIRTNTAEHLRFGADENTTWATKLIAGNTLFWSRLRIVTTVTTLPVFQQFKVSPSRFEANNDGTNTYHGIARFRQTIMSAGNVFGEVGGVTNYSLTVGSGGLPTGWAHPIKNSQLNGNGDAISFQFVIPRGCDTSIPLTFRVYYVPTAVGAADVDLILSAAAREVAGIEEADPTGGTTPVPRTLANTATLTATAGTAVTRTIDSTVGTKIQSVDFGPYSVATLYEGDIVLARLELDDDGVGNADIGIVAVEVAGAQWTNGERL
jgi:hypothetical protein